MPKTALITSVSGQHGAYLSCLLLQKSSRVAGAVRCTAAPRMSPTTTLADLVTMMVEANDRRVRENRLLY